MGVNSETSSGLGGLTRPIGKAIKAQKIKAIKIKFSDKKKPSAK